MHVQIDGKHHNLGIDKAAAFNADHGLMEQRSEFTHPRPFLPND
jgi:hypothetical protein